MRLCERREEPAGAGRPVAGCRVAESSDGLSALTALATRLGSTRQSPAGLGLGPTALSTNDHDAQIGPKGAQSQPYLDQYVYELCVLMRGSVRRAASISLRLPWWHSLHLLTAADRASVTATWVYERVLQASLVRRAALASERVTCRWEDGSAGNLNE